MIWECHIVHHKSHTQIGPVMYSETRISMHIWVDGLTMWSNAYQNHPFCTWCCWPASLSSARPFSKPAILGAQLLKLLLSTAGTPYVYVYFDSLIYDCKLHAPIKRIINGTLRPSQHQGPHSSSQLSRETLWFLSLTRCSWVNADTTMMKAKDVRNNPQGRLWILRPKSQHIKHG